jgi:hypothetical protein
MVPYYVSVRKYNEVVSPKHNARPTEGWIIESEAFYNKYFYLKNTMQGFVKKFIENDVYIRIMNLLVFAPYNTAVILQQLNHLHTDIMIDPATYASTLKKGRQLKQLSSDTIIKLRNEGRISAVLESTGGHVDNYTGVSNPIKDSKFLESKISLCRGKTHHIIKPKVAENFINVPLPLGALAYPLYGIYTNCCPLQEIECHSLQNVVHISKRDNVYKHRTAVVSEFPFKEEKNSDGTVAEPDANDWLFEKGCALTFVPYNDK